ncbi:MAG: DUF1641 domain-containing protein [Chlorobi bacterium]|nr:DUF1641 domain-containing protein [Chlorobiota bacterium]
MSENKITTEVNMQEQINEINRKLDLVLEEVYAQKQSRETMTDLVDDLSIVGKDVFQTTVQRLDKEGVELDADTLASIGIRLLANLENINNMLEMMESMNDFVKDVSPIAHQVGLTAIEKVNELDQKGYIDFFKEMAKVGDNIITHFTLEDVRELADKIVPILEMVKEITQPDMLESVHNAVVVYKNLETDNIPEYSIWKVLREMNSPEMKKGMGFMMSFLKNLTAQQLKPKD